MNISGTTIDEKIGQLFFIGLPGTEICDAAEKLLKDIAPGGVCLFSRNIREPQQVRSLLDGVRQRAAVEPFLSLDQEGGLVDRLRRVLSPMPAPSKLKTVEDAAELATIIATATRILGFNMDFAPVLDVVDESRAGFSNGLHSRAFGKSRTDVVELAGAFLSTLQANKTLGCIKHFPGLGASEVDSHEELPLVNIDEQTFSSVDLFPYEQMLSRNLVSAIMVAHAAYPKLGLQEMDQNGKLLPSSLSFNVVTTLLRERLGYSGLVVTDDLEMGAILKNYGIGEACVLAILAGQDMLAICAGVDAIYDGFTAVKHAVSIGRISDERLNQSLERISRAKLQLSPPKDFDLIELAGLSERIDLLNNRLK